MLLKSDYNCTEQIKVGLLLFPIDLTGGSVYDCFSFGYEDKIEMFLSFFINRIDKLGNGENKTENFYSGIKNTCLNVCTMFCYVLRVNLILFDICFYGCSNSTSSVVLQNCLALFMNCLLWPC